MTDSLSDLPENATMRDIFDFCVKHNLHNLAQGMIELAPPEKLRESAARSCVQNEDLHQYRNRMGEDDYRSALSFLFQHHYHLNVPKDAILATSGVTGGIVSTLMTLKNEKNGQTPKVGLLVPFYTYHCKQIMDLFGSEPVYIASNEDFSPNFQAIEQALQGGLDLLMFTNPGNPQGNVWTKEDLQTLVQLTEKYHTMMLIDEVYCDLVWKGTFYTPLQDKLYDHVIVCRGFSKTLGCQSWRIGYLVSSPSVVARIMRLHDPIYISVPWIQHSLGEYLSKDYADFVNHVKRVGDLMQANWRTLAPVMKEAFGLEPIDPHGSMYGMFKHASQTDREAVLLGLEHGVGVAPGKIFFPGNQANTGYVRIHCGISAAKAQKIAEAIKQKAAERKH